MSPGWCGSPSYKGPKATRQWISMQRIRLDLHLIGIQNRAGMFLKLKLHFMYIGLYLMVLQRPELLTYISIALVNGNDHFNIVATIYAITHSYNNNDSI